MFEWMSEHYIRLIANFRILLGNPTHCNTVELLRLFSLTLFIVFLVKLVIHLFVFYRLRKKFSRYSQGAYPRLFRLYQISAQKAKLCRLPDLYQFSNKRPVLFTIGSLKPAIFLAPTLIDKLSPEELEAALVHELIHVKRHDNLLVWFLEVFFVSIPVVIIQISAIGFIFNIQNSVYAILSALAVIIVFKAFLWKRILFLRELSCDDLSVGTIQDPLLLASSLVNVWRVGSVLPKHRWQTALAFAQTLLPVVSNPEKRVRRLINYRRPWLKFFLGKAIRVASILLVISTASFLWGFYSTASHGTFIHDNDNGCGIYYNQAQSASPRESSVVSGEDLSAERFVEVVSRFAQALNQEDYDRMGRELGKEITNKYPEKLTRFLVRNLLRSFGKIQELGSPQVVSSNQAIFPAQFEHVTLDMQVTLDDQDKIANLSFQLPL